MEFLPFLSHLVTCLDSATLHRLSVVVAAILALDTARAPSSRALN